MKIASHIIGSLAFRLLCSVGLVLPLLLTGSAHGQTGKAATASGFRTITVVSQPGTKIWIDDVLFGTTGEDGKLVIKTLSSGAHTLRARADGFVERKQQITAIQKGVVRIDLAKTTDEAELAFQKAERLTAVDREKAVDAYRTAIKLRPAFPEAWLALARTLADMGDIEAAEKAIASARKHRPVYPEALAVLGRIYKDGGEETKAIDTFKRAITEGRGFQPEAYAGLGLLYKEKAEGYGSSGEFDKEDAAHAEAAKNLKQSLKQLSGAPDATVIYQLLGLIYEKQKRWSDAIATYEEFLRIFPDTVEATAVRSFIVQIKKEMSPPRQ